MKPFDLEKALQGHPLITDCGRSVSVFRERLPYEDVDEFPYEAIIEGEAYPIGKNGRIAGENIYSWGGKCFREDQNYISIRRLFLKDCDWKPEPKMGDKILVEYPEGKWHKRLFVKMGENNGVIIVSNYHVDRFKKGLDFRTVHFDNWKWPEEEKESVIDKITPYMDSIQENWAKIKAYLEEIEGADKEKP